MAKNLQSVLNSVVSDLLQEGLAEDMQSAFGKAATARNAMAQAAYAGAAKAAEDDWNARIPGQTVAAAAETWKDGLPEVGSSTPFTNAGIKTRFGVEDSLSPWEKAQIYGGKAVDWAGDQAEAIKQSMLAHPGYWGTGLGAALAAGAGAMYLRKKKKEADLAAGK